MMRPVTLTFGLIPYWLDFGELGVAAGGWSVAFSLNWLQRLSLRRRWTGVFLSSCMSTRWRNRIPKPGKEGLSSRGAFRELILFPWSL